MRCADWLLHLAQDETGHDLLEYALLLAILALGSALFFAASGRSPGAPWSLHAGAHGGGPRR